MYEAAMKRAEETGKNEIHHGQGRRVFITYFPDRQTLLERLSASQEETVQTEENLSKERLIPEKSTILIKASHGMEFAEVLEFLRLRLA